MFILQLFNNQTADWFEINEAGEITAHHHIADLSECPKINPTENLVVLLPGETVTLTSVKLPKMRLSERAQAIPFALEEQLASEPDSIQVAVGDTQNDGTVTVAIIEKTILEAQLNALHNVNLYPRIMLPDFLGIILEPETWSIVLQDQMAIVRTDFQNGFSVDANNLLLFLQLNLEKNKAHKPKKIICWQKNAVLDVSQLEKVGVPIEMRGESKYSYFDVKNLTTKFPLNFLQGKYRSKGQSSELQKNWLICGVSVAALIGFLFLSNIAQWIYFRYQSAILENKILLVYKTLFPTAKTVLEPRFRTANLLKKFDSASQGGNFLKIVGIAGKTALTLPGLQIVSFEYKNEKLALTVNANSVSQLSEWSKGLRAEGLQIQQHILSTEKNNVHAEITIQEPA